MSTIPLSDQIACVTRELGMRRRVYPRWIESGRMRQEESDREIARMEAVLATLQGLAEKERLL